MCEGTDKEVLGESICGSSDIASGWYSRVGFGVRRPSSDKSGLEQLISNIVGAVRVFMLIGVVARFSSFDWPAMLIIGVRMAGWEVLGVGLGMVVGVDGYRLILECVSSGNVFGCKF